MMEMLILSKDTAHDFSFIWLFLAHFSGNFWKGTMSMSFHVFSKWLGPLVKQSGEPKEKRTISGRSSGNILA